MIKFFKPLIKFILLLVVYLITNSSFAACPNLTLGFTAPTQVGCGVPQNFSFTNTSSGTAANNNTAYIWKIDGVRVDSINGTGNFNYTFLGPGTYTVRLVAFRANGCSDSIQQTVTITSNVAPIYDGNAALTFTPRWSNCIINVNQTNNYTILVASNTALNNYTIQWGDGSPDNSGATLAIGNTVSHTYTTLGLFTVKIITTNLGCVDTLFGTVVNMRPVSAAIKPLAPGQLSGCAPHTITFQDTTQYAFPGTILTWSFGDGTTIVRDWTQANQPISHTYQSIGNGNCNYTVSLSAINTNCNTGIPSVYTISPILIFDKDQAEITPPGNLCSPSLTYTFANTSDDNCISGQRLYYWDFGDGTNTGWIASKLPQTHTFPTTGTYVITLIDSNACGSDTTTNVVIINKPPLAGFTATPKYGCAPLLVTLADTSLGTGNTRTWTMLGGLPNFSTQANTATTFTLPGTYVIKLSVSNVCSTGVEAFDTIRVYAKPAVSIGNAVSGCVPHTLQLTNNTANQSPTATYFWDFGNGVTSTQNIPPPVTYLTTGSFTIKLKVTDSCGIDSQQVTIAVSTIPAANFTTNVVCQGNATTFTNTSTTAIGDVITQYDWFYGNGDSTINGSAPQLYQYPTNGNFTALLKITTDKNCVDTQTVNVFVKSSPTVGFTTLPDTVCLGTPINFNGTSTTALPASISSYNWSFGTVGNAQQEDTSFLFTSAGNYTVSFTAGNNAGCSATIVKPVRVGAIPDAQFSKSISCTNQHTFYTDLSVVQNTDTISYWLWDFDSDGNTDSTSQNPSYIFTNVGSKKTKLTAITQYGCSNTDSLSFNVNQTPTPAIASSSSSFCANDSVTFTNNSIGAFAYAWNVGNNTGDFFMTTTDPYSYTYNDSGTYTVKLVAYSLQGCKDSVTTVVTARPLPIAQFEVNDTVGCAPQLFTFNNTSLLADSFKWFTYSTLTSSDTIRSDTLISVSGQVVPISLVAYNNFNCKPDTAVLNLYTFSNPLPNFVMSADSGCGPLQVTFTNTTPAAISYFWQLGNNDTSTNVNAQSTYLPALVTDSVYVIKLIALNGSGCSDSISKTVKVFPQPASIFSTSVNNGCGPLQVQFTNQSQHHYGGTINDMQFKWDYGNGDSATVVSPLHAFNSHPTKDTTYTVKLVAFSKYGCSDTATTGILVYPNPDANFVVNNPAGCAPLTTSFSNQSTPNDTGNIQIMSFNWLFGNGQSSTQVNPSAIFLASNATDSVYPVKLIAYSEHGCADSSINPVRVYPNPTANFSLSTPQGCGPLVVQFQNNSIPNDTGSIADMQFFWNYGNGMFDVTIQGNSIFTAKQLVDTTYYVTLTAYSEHGCIDTAIKTVVVHPNPVTNFTSDKNSGCGPLEVSFTNTSLLATQHTWDFSDGTQSNTLNPVHTFQSFDIFDSIYKVSLSTQSVHGCLGDTINKFIIARYNPIADFFPSADSICGTGNIAFFNGSLGGTQNTWNFGNGNTSAAINPVNQFTASTQQDTSYQIRLITKSPYGCVDTAWNTVKVNVLPQASFSAILPACTPYPVTFNNTSNQGYSYEWNFGDATTDTAKNPTKTFLNQLVLINRIYPVLLTVKTISGCVDTALQNVTVYPLPVPSITAQKSLRCDTAEYHFLNATQGANNFIWSFGDNTTSTQTTPTHYYKTSEFTDTTYTVKLTASSALGCLDSSTLNVAVKPLVIADFNAPTTNRCLDLDVNFINQSKNAINYFWFFGDGGGTNVTNPNYKYLFAGSYDVTLIAYNAFGCSDTTTKTNFVNIHEVPTAQFSFNPISPQEPNTQVNFSNLSTISSGSLSYTWDFNDPLTGNNNASTDKDPVHVFSDSGNYVITLIVTSNFGCTDTIQKPLKVRTNIPAPDFTADALSGCKPLTVNFTNQSLYASSYRWDFGDGTRSTEENPTHTFTRNDEYTITLTAYGPGGDSTIQKIKYITVHDLPRARFIANPTTLYLPNGYAAFTNTSFDAITSLWILSDSIEEIFTDTNYHSGYNFTRDGYYTLSLIVTNQFGCVDTSTIENVIYVDRAGAIYVPNAFSPNGDGTNETFAPSLIGVSTQNYKLSIYDRWGKQVYETTNIYDTWDGKSDGKPAASDVYIWLIEATLATGERYVKEGTVTLLR